MQAYSIIRYHHEKYNQAIKEVNIALNDQILSENPFFSRNSEWIKEKKDELLKKKIKELQLQRDNRISTAFKSFQLNSQLYLYNDFIKFLDEIDYPNS